VLQAQKQLAFGGKNVSKSGRAHGFSTTGARKTAEIRRFLRFLAQNRAKIDKKGLKAP